MEVLTFLEDPLDGFVKAYLCRTPYETLIRLGRSIIMFFVYSMPSATLYSRVSRTSTTHLQY